MNHRRDPKPKSQAPPRLTSRYFFQDVQPIWCRSRSAMCAAECAVRFEPVCANMGFFATSIECFRAGLVMGKSLKRW